MNMEEIQKEVERLENELRMMWTLSGMPKEKQDAILKEVEEKSSEGYMNKFFEGA
jgi:hypothetical protein